MPVIPRFLVLALFAALPALSAEEWTWIGAQNNQWGVKANWMTASASATPQPGDTVRLKNATHLPTQQNIAGLSIQKLIFESDCPAFTVAGSAITVGKGGVEVQVAAGALALATPIVLADQQHWTVPTGQTLAVTGALAATAMTLSISGTNTLGSAVISNLSSGTTPNYADYITPGLPIESLAIHSSWIVSGDGASLTHTRPALLNITTAATVGKALLVNGGGTLDLSSANGSAFELPLIVYGGVVKFSPATQLQRGVVIDRAAELQFRAGSGTFTMARPVVSLSVLNAGATEAETATLRVAPGDTLIIPSAPGTALGINAATKGGAVANGFRLTGGGRVEFTAPEDSPNYAVASLRLESQTAALNALPLFSNPPGQFDSGVIESFGASTLNVRANAERVTTQSNGVVTPSFTPAAALPLQYGFRRVSALNGTLNVNIEANALFQSVQRLSENAVLVAADATLNVTGADDTALFRMARASGAGPVSNTLNTGRFSLRGGQFYVHSAPPNAPYNVFPAQAGFTLALNGGLFNGNFVDDFLGHLVVNDAPNNTPRIDNFALTGSGTVHWGAGVLEKVNVTDATGGHDSSARNHVLRFNRSSGSVSVDAGAVLRISAGTVVLEGAKNSLLNDDATRAVAVENNADLTIAANDQAIGSLSGTQTAASVSVAGVKLTIQNASNTTYHGTFTGSGEIAKQGIGTLRLTGDSSGFAGTVTIVQGMLRADNANSSTGSGPLEVQSAGTLSGTGRVNASVGLHGTLAPGSNPFAAGDNTLQTASLSVLAGSTLRFSLTTPASVLDDELNVAGDLAIQSGSVAIENAGGFVSGEYRLLTYTGTFSGDASQLSVVEMPAGYAGKIIHDTTAKELRLIALIPPTTTIATPTSQIFRAATWPGAFAGAVTLVPGQTLATVEFSLRDAGGNYWNGTSFNATSEQWLAMTFNAANWSQNFPINQFANDGAFALRVKSTDIFANAENPPATRSFSIDRQAPVVTVTPLATSTPSPALSGTVNDPAATVLITAHGVTRTATNLGNGTWTLAAGQLPARPAGTYEVLAQATDLAGNSATDTSSNELVITLPDITVSPTIAPTSGTAAGGTLVSFTGTNLDLVTAVLFGGVVATIQTKTSTALSVHSPEHDAGAVGITIQSLSNTLTLPAAFTYFNPPPSIASIAPARVSTQGGTTITINGAGFLPGAIVQVQGKLAANVVRISKSVLTAEAPPNAPGPAAVTIVNPDQKAVSLPNAVTYDAPPRLARALQLNTSQLRAGDPVQLLFELSDPEGQSVTFVIDWGDGTAQASSAFHTYSAAGMYTIQLLASDGIGTVAFPLIVTVLAGPNGGGGTPDTPTGEALLIDSLSGSVRFDQVGKDTWQVKGVFPAVPKNTVFENSTCLLGAGGVAEMFTLSAKGKAKSASGAFALKLKFLRNKATKISEFVGGTVPFAAKVKGSFSDDWQDEGLSSAVEGKNIPAVFAVFMALAGREFSRAVPTTMQSKSGKSAKFSFKLGR